MTFKRTNVYPDGTVIPPVLPQDYQPASYGEAPLGQACYSCAAYQQVGKYCTIWGADVRPSWWCDEWVPPQEAKPVLKVTHSIVEEHFSEMPKPKPKYNVDSTGMYIENEEDVLKVNVPLMIRLLEWAREDACKDTDVHIVAEQLIELSEQGNILTMSNYPEIVQGKENFNKGE